MDYGLEYDSRQISPTIAYPTLYERPAHVSSS